MNKTDIFSSILKSSKSALSKLLDIAEKLDYDPPVPCDVVTDLEDIIFECQKELSKVLTISEWYDKMIDAGFDGEIISNFIRINSEESEDFSKAFGEQEEKARLLNIAPEGFKTPGLVLLEQVKLSESVVSEVIKGEASAT